ncbi:hypothetical protein SB5439_04971 [Klebsiella variicola]|uniref:type II toxin-antitoxin system death-on-curing family toxin n=1 Tax=Klebsiella variicola TaxID=244366 RepID=UPI00109D27B7|nr:type II toxin-antitoxin system death-on-curing family toxin [Klebsiella variicola]VGQ11599.1 hypothetical protein SB5439_04971 [Klebsiella variicola]
MIIISEHVLQRLHDRLIEEYGGLPGMPDPGRISAILSRIENALYYLGLSDEFEIAALYMVSIARGHIFNDGNKRTALATALFHLARNNIITRDDEEAERSHVELTVRAATGEAELQEIAEHFRKYQAH